MTHVSPAFKIGAFNCPYCTAYANTAWSRLLIQLPQLGFTPIYQAICAHCNKKTYWISNSDGKAENSKGQMIFPEESDAPLPHYDIPEDAKKDYMEARDILSKSPRAACALLRLVVQKLCVSLGEKGKNINEDIGNLVRKGLPIEIQQSLDIVRVIGNNAVHPGELIENDVDEIAATLFEVINYIVEDRISRPKKLKELFDKLPEGSRDAIERRDFSK